MQHGLGEVLGQNVLLEYVSLTVVLLEFVRLYRVGLDSLLAPARTPDSHRPPVHRRTKLGYRHLKALLVADVTPTRLNLAPTEETGTLEFWFSATVANVILSSLPQTP